MPPFKLVITSLTVLMTALLLAGCSYKGAYETTESRYWSKIEYTETLTISSEPTGARIYVQDRLIGRAPVKVELGPVIVRADQSGSYWERYISDPPILGGGTRNQGRSGPTTWGDLKWTMKEGSTWKVTAVMDGFQTMTKTYTLSVSSHTFQGACRNVLPDDEERLSHIRGEGALLIALKRLAPVGGPPSAQQQQQQQQQTIVIPSASAMEAIGKVMVSSTPDSSDIYVDGLFAGNSPVTLPLGAGVHVVEVRKLGFITWKREIRVLKDSVTTLRVELKKE